jgi:ornithine cyclodeaminase/alanine dehydrogenase-like protein (mu-crystallin family)
MPAWLGEEEVRAVLQPLELFDAIESALADFSAGRVVQPVRTALDMGDRSAFYVMPALYRAQGVPGAKLVTVVPQNAGRGLHTHQAAIALFDSETGSLEAVLDGRYITEIRTAAASAVSAKYLARPSSAVLAILGSGVQAASHYEALRSIFPLREVRVWSPTAERRNAFAAARPGTVAPPTAEEATRGADIVVLATSAVTPAIRSEWVNDGAHVIAIGAARPNQREIDPRLVARAALIVDSRAAALVESGDIVMSMAEGFFGEDHVRGVIGAVVTGAIAGRRSDAEVTLFKSLGLAVEDMAAAALAWRRWKAAG